MQPELATSGGRPIRGDAHPTIVKRSSRRHDDEGHGGAWKVAFADFCLALLCLFLVLWLLASRNSERMQVVLQNAGANLIEDGQGLTNSLAAGSRGSMIERHPVPARSEELSAGDPQHGSTDARVGRPSLDSPEQLQALARRIAGLAAEEGLQGHLRTAVTPQGLRLQLHDTEASGMFERGSAQPAAPLRALLRKLGPLLAEIRNQLLIVGHTDATAYQDKGPGAFTNWALSSHRAMAARHELLAGGMPESSVLQVSGMADAAPLDVLHPTAAVNRRIELMLLTSAQAQTIAALYGPAGLRDPAPDPAEQLRGALAPARAASGTPNTAKPATAPAKTVAPSSATAASAVADRPAAPPAVPAASR
ncbi:flagellar motor protein MotB [Roseateles chitosanitabidus]|uniref:flagellar motor protein MotB n=1 Tax=Roseateles chitosanitabidus TaxID=65048 RepID=UPI000830A03C|nr:flagellar motor protein MotB [Roseateles chitosanitabidus]